MYHASIQYHWNSQLVFGTNIRALCVLLLYSNVIIDNGNEYERTAKSNSWLREAKHSHIIFTIHPRPMKSVWSSSIYLLQWSKLARNFSTICKYQLQTSEVHVTSMWYMGPESYGLSQLIRIWIKMQKREDEGGRGRNKWKTQRLFAWMNSNLGNQSSFFLSNSWLPRFVCYFFFLRFYLVATEIVRFCQDAFIYTHISTIRIIENGSFVLDVRIQSNASFRLDREKQTSKHTETCRCFEKRKKNEKRRESDYNHNTIYTKH